MSNRVKQLESLRAEALLGGGKDRLEAQHKRGKLTARRAAQCDAEADRGLCSNPARPKG